MNSNQESAGTMSKSRHRTISHKHASNHSDARPSQTPAGKARRAARRRTRLARRASRSS